MPIAAVLGSGYLAGTKSLSLGKVDASTSPPLINITTCACPAGRPAARAYYGLLCRPESLRRPAHAAGLGAGSQAGHPGNRLGKVGTLWVRRRHHWGVDPPPGDEADPNLLVYIQAALTWTHMPKRIQE